jgi:hypothetical protein
MRRILLKSGGELLILHDEKTGRWYRRGFDWAGNQTGDYSTTEDHVVKTWMDPKWQTIRQDN